MLDKKSKFGVAIIGAGLIGRKRAEAIKSISKLTLMGVFDVDNKASKVFAKDFNCNKYTNVAEILNDKKVNLVVLAIQHKAAAKLAPKILEKKNLLLEKPIGRTLKETKIIIESAEKFGKKLFAGFNYRFYPHVSLLKKYLLENKLGTIVSSSFKIGHAAFPGYEKTWKMDKELCGGGVILDPGIHMIDLMLFLIGSPEKKTVFENKLGWNSAIEDEAIVVFSYKNKAFSKHHYSLNFSKNIFEIEVVGEKGVAKLEGRGGNYGSMTFNFTPRWFWKNNKKIINRDFGPKDLSFRDELINLNKILSGSRTPDYSVYLDSMSIVGELH